MNEYGHEIEKALERVELSDGAKAYLHRLLALGERQAQAVKSGEVDKGGRTILAHLPFGMDVVK